MDPDSKRLRVSVSDGTGRAVRDGGLARWLAAVAPPRAAGEVNVALVSDLRMRALNRKYRRKDKVTDVLAFAPTTTHLGDLAIATGVARRQARDAGHSYQTELRVLALAWTAASLGLRPSRSARQRPDGRVEAALRRKGGLASRSNRAGVGAARVGEVPAGGRMIALLLLLALAAIYVGTIETAFSALMRLSLRLMVERGGSDDRLGFYLDDPIQLFMPARLMLGLIFSLATVVLAVLTGSEGFSSIGMLLLFVAVFILVFEHVLPLLIVRRNPEKALELLLPPFDFAASFLHPLTGTLVRLIVDSRSERDSPVAANGSEESSGEVAPGAETGEEPHLIEREERALLQSIVDFGGTLVREVMTPRPDIVAIPAEATLGRAARALPRAGVFPHPGVQGESRQHPGHRLRQGSRGARPRRTLASSRSRLSSVRRCSFPRPSGCRSSSRSSSAGRCRWRSSSTSTAARRVS